MIGPFDGLYEFLSNFYKWPVEYDGALYSSVEAAFQAAKTLDLKARAEIAAAPTPGAAKKLGRKVVLRPNWEEMKLQVMEECLRDKFSDPAIGDLLLKTGDEELVEINYWGDCFYGKCGGYGANHLGILLMKIRQELKDKPQTNLPKLEDLRNMNIDFGEGSSEKLVREIRDD